MEFPWILAVFWLTTSYSYTDGTTTPASQPTCTDSSCSTDQYCINAGTGAVCLSCNEACDGCTSSTVCTACKPGFYLQGSVCRACAAGKYGVNCNGTCHCKDQQTCDQSNGACDNFECDYGWTDPPFCQTPCNGTFGADCVFVCHCPPGKACDPVNGLCEDFTCATDYAGPSCQIWLTRLQDPPQVENVTCNNATVVWRGWRFSIDNGDKDSKVSNYELYFMTRDMSDWQLERQVTAVPGQDTYTVDLVNLLPDTDYRFRVDVRQLDPNAEGKFLRSVAGKASEYVFIPCTVLSSTVSPTAIPEGPHKVLDASQFNVSLVAPDAIQLEWTVFDNVTGYTVNVTVQHYVSGIGDCLTVSSPEVTTSPVPMNGSFDLTDLLSWRHYVVIVTAFVVDLNITDFISRTVLTGEAAPIGNLTNVTVEDIAATTALASWVPLPCEDRGGSLLYYWLQAYTLPDRNLLLNVSQTGTSYRMPGLVPYTQYGFVVKYVNSQGTSGTADLTTFTTLEDVPGPPTITSIKPGTTSLNITLQPPSDVNGVLTTYIVTIDTSQNFSSPQTKSQNVADGVVIVMQNLSPFTKYFIKASAVTGAGSGPFSATTTAVTLELPPGPPGTIVSAPEGRNVSCLNVTWQEPAAAQGIILNYTVQYRAMAVSDQVYTNVTNGTSIVLCGLLPGQYYEFDITAVNSAGVGQSGRIRLSTEQDDPPPPPPAVILNITATTIAVALDPVVLTTGPLSGYLVFVNEVTVQRRALSTSNTTCPSIAEVPGYIARNFTPGEILVRTEFVIGNGVQYGDYLNAPLKYGSVYDIYYVLISYLEDICKYSVTKTAGSVVVSTPVPIITTDAPGPNVGLIVGIVIAVVLLLVLIAVVVICLYRRFQTDDHPYKPYTDEKYDLHVFKVEYDLQKYWNKIYSLRESRYIVAGREFLPDDKQLMNGSVLISNTNPPMTFSDEFHNLPHGPLSSCGVAKRRENEFKNRFNHLLPYDQTRVVLSEDVNSQGTYINANFIHGYKRQRAYIAAQSPFDEETVLDFWRMIYQYEINVVVMVSNIMEDNIVKCTQYWPSNGRVMYGAFILDLVSIQEFADYIIRTIKIRMKNDPEWQVVYQFDFCSWPNHGVPDDAIPLLEMRQKIREYQNRDMAPIVVHCGTGVSRSGVYIAIDSLLEQYENEGRISVFSFVRKMRKDRVAMVRTVKQYIFVYEALFEARVAGKTRAGYDLKEQYHFLTQKNPNTGHSYLHDQFKCLQLYTRKLYPQDCKDSLTPANVNKNRFSEVVPPDSYRLVLTSPGGLGRTDYVNAVYLDSHHRQNHYILTQTPLHTTVIDFWKLVYDHNVHTIVMMENYRHEDDTCAEYWPETNMKQFEPFFVETVNVFQQENITIRNLKLVSMNSPHKARQIRQFQFNAWSDTEFVPKSKSMLLDAMDLVADWQEISSHDSSPILVHCKDGATHSGLFCAVSILCEVLAEDAEVDIFHTVKHLKRRRNQIVDTMDQYRFCYKTLWDYMNMRLPGGTLTEKMSGTRSDKPYSSLSLASYKSGYDQDFYA